MTSSDDLSDDRPPPRRPIFFPVVIATVFLTIIGMTAGFLLGERHRRLVRASAEQTADPGVVSQPTAAPVVNPAGPACPPETQLAAQGVPSAGEVYQVFKIRTENGTTVWICQDSAGALFYQGKTGGLDAPLVQKKNGLFLPGVTETSAGHYEVTAPNGSQLVVDKAELVVNFAGGGSETHQVVSD